jgi:ribosomal protein S18 acetylase RimI-like enzyme
VVHHPSASHDPRQYYLPVATAECHTRNVRIPDAVATDQVWVRELLVSRWGATSVVSREVVHEADRLPALVAEDPGPVGLLTYAVHDGDLEVVTLDAVSQDVGVGTALVAAVRRRAADLGCGRLWLITTNDNVRALRFYQRRGLRVVKVHTGAVDRARATIKPSIPLVGDNGIEIHDEIELAMDGRELRGVS